MRTVSTWRSLRMRVERRLSAFVVLGHSRRIRDVEVGSGYVADLGEKNAGASSQFGMLVGRDQFAKGARLLDLLIDSAMAVAHRFAEDGGVTGSDDAALHGLAKPLKLVM